MSKLRKARVIKTGKEIEVYSLINGGWCDYADCKTTYTDEELKFLEE